MQTNETPIYYGFHGIANFMIKRQVEAAAASASSDLTTNTDRIVSLARESELWASTDWAFCVTEPPLPISACIGNKCGQGSSSRKIATLRHVQREQSKR